uniref:NADH-ubiquinone oxidoreductase chain 5 n=1 Tax=Pujadella villari TaxID=2943468 RepID=A0A9E8GDI8_9HYME|nr:NADH dehydrogenase subunit 5 [Pujadella villari]
MIIYILISMYLWTSSIWLFLLSLLFLINKKIILLDWMILFMNSCNMKFIIYIDWMTLMFSSVVLLISSMVMWYSLNYMMNEKKKNYFSIILFMFVMSMLIMIMSPNILSVILGWDGLGLISYCLIIYYQNLYSFNSGMMTLLSNRVGDTMLMMMIFFMNNIGSWNLMSFSFNNLTFTLMMLMMIMTKSAQTPFSMWLPAAMAAPTPVSALVHSSTLVTAGVYLMIRFNKIFFINKMNLTIMMIGLMTMLTASINALMEFDFKKIIAFSTLSQLGLMITMLSMNMSPNYIFFHLISHAMFKSLLFLCSGVIIHSMNNHQDIRFMGKLVTEMPLTMMIFNFSNLSLCGFPFLSGYFSKDSMYDMLIKLNINMKIYYLMFFCICLTLMYSLRLTFYLTINPSMSPPLNMNLDPFYMIYPMLPLLIMTILYGSSINWILFSTINLNLNDLISKLNMYMMMMISLKIFYIMNNNLNQIKFKFINIMNSMSSFFLLKNMSIMMNNKFILINNNIFTLNEQYWNEFYNKMFPFMYLNLLMKFFNKMFNNKFITLILLIMHMTLLLILFNF